MPSMPRIPGKGLKIAYKLLGVPPNIAYKPNAQQKKIDHVLLFQQTTRAR